MRQGDTLHKKRDIDRNETKRACWAGSYPQADMPTEAGTTLRKAGAGCRQYDMDIREPASNRLEYVADEKNCFDGLLGVKSCC